MPVASRKSYELQHRASVIAVLAELRSIKSIFSHSRPQNCLLLSAGVVLARGTHHFRPQSHPSLLTDGDLVSVSGDL